MQMTGLFYIILAVIADVIANVCLKNRTDLPTKSTDLPHWHLSALPFCSWRRRW